MSGASRAPTRSRSRAVCGGQHGRVGRANRLADGAGDEDDYGHPHYTDRFDLLLVERERAGWAQRALRGCVCERTGA